MDRRSVPVPADRIVVNTAVPGELSPVIALVGTSLTATSTWPDALLDHLSICLETPPRVDIIAQPAATSVWGLDQVDSIIATDAHIVVIEFAINDADIRIGQPLSAARETHEKIVSAIRDGLPHAAIYLMTTNPALGRAEGRRPALAAYYRAYEELAEELDLGMVDGYRRWLMQEDLPGKLPDGLHPTDSAAEAVFLPVLAPMIATTLGQDPNACAAP